MIGRTFKMRAKRVPNVQWVVSTQKAQDDAESRRGTLAAAPLETNPRTTLMVRGETFRLQADCPREVSNPAPHGVFNDGARPRSGSMCRA